MRLILPISLILLTPLLHAVEWSIEQCSSLDLLAGRTGIADVRPSNDPHHNSSEMMEQNSGIYRGQWSWQSEMPELLYEIMHTGEALKLSPSGFSALQAACVYADETLFNALLDAGCAIDSRPGDWQQLGYVGDTPLGLLVRFMNSRTAAARVRMARVLLERGANPDAPMTTWKGNRVVTSVPFNELGNLECNHEMRLLLLQFGEQDLTKRLADWSLNWEWFRADLVQHLQQRGVTRTKSDSQIPAAKKHEAGSVPLLDLIRKGDVEGVRLALESGASIEISARARRYGHEPLFNIPARRKDNPEAAVAIARLLYEAGADVNILNRRGRSLRIHYDRYHSKASRALCAYFKECGSLIHPDSPDRLEEVARSKQDALARAAAFAAKCSALNQSAENVSDAATPAAPQPAPAEEPAPQPSVAEPQPAPAEEPAPQPSVAEPQPAPAEEPAPQPSVAEPQPAPAEEPAPQPSVAEPLPAPAEEPAPQPSVAEPQPVPAEEPAPQPSVAEPQPVPAEAPAPQPTEAEQQSAPEKASASPENSESEIPPSASTAANRAAEYEKKLLLEVQNQLRVLQAKFEEEQRLKEQQEKSGQPAAL